MARVRSPNYPALSLKEALQKVGQVFERERQHPASREVVMKGMGYSGVNGASLSALSAARKYGLLVQQGRGEDYTVTDLAVTILHPHSPEEKAEAVRKAAFAPALFAELLTHYKGDIPSDDNLRAYLVRRGFATAALSGVIQSFRETIELVGRVPSGYAPSISSEEDDNDGQEVPFVDPQESATTRSPSKSGVDQRPMRVSFDGNKLEVAAVLTDSESVERLINILRANQALLPARNTDDQ